MLPRISEHSNIPHVSLAVALMNLSGSQGHTTNMYHPSTHSFAVDSTPIQQQALSKLPALYLSDTDLSNIPDEVVLNIVIELQTVLLNVIKQLKAGHHNSNTSTMSVNEKSVYCQELINRNLTALGV